MEINIYVCNKQCEENLDATNNLSVKDTLILYAVVALGTLTAIGTFVGIGKFIEWREEEAYNARRAAFMVEHQQTLYRGIDTYWRMVRRDHEIRQGVPPEERTPIGRYDPDKRFETMPSWRDYFDVPEE